LRHEQNKKRSSPRAVLWARRDENKRKEKKPAIKGRSLPLFSGHDVAHLDPGINQPAYMYASSLPILRVQSSILIFISKRYIVIIFMVFVQYFSVVAKMDAKENNGTRLLPSTSNKRYQIMHMVTWIYIFQYNGCHTHQKIISINFHWVKMHHIHRGWMNTRRNLRGREKEKDLHRCLKREGMN
jgi:hypothetical protein